FYAVIVDPSLGRVTLFSPLQPSWSCNTATFSQGERWKNTKLDSLAIPASWDDPAKKDWIGERKALP
ncbi:MAG: hypothetical protein WBQ94_02380, partial [Terracidiphilus sp.]